jgi:toxin FitB
MYLVDTNVISAATPSKAAAPANLVTWMDERSAALYLSDVTIAEIIAKARREGATRRAKRLAD